MAIIEQELYESSVIETNKSLGYGKFNGRPTTVMHLPDVTWTGLNSLRVSLLISILPNIFYYCLSQHSDLTKRLAARNQGITRIEKNMRLIQINRELTMTLIAIKYLNCLTALIIS
jgi:hypothetical protein